QLPEVRRDQRDRHASAEGDQAHRTGRIRSGADAHREWSVKLAAIIVAAVLGALAAAVYLFGAAVLTEPLETYRWYVHSAGHRALFMCSAHYIAGRAPKDIVNWELRYADGDFTAPGEALLEPEARSAVGKTAHGLIARRAAFEAGRGCVLLPPGGSAA